MYRKQICMGLLKPLIQINAQSIMKLKKEFNEFKYIYTIAYGCQNLNKKAYYIITDLNVLKLFFKTINTKLVKLN